MPATGIPLPRNPMRFTGAGLQVGGVHTAVTVAWLGKLLVTRPVPATLRFWDSVEAKFSVRPLIGLCWAVLSVALATTVCGELGVTVAVVLPFTDSEMVAGGQVEKYPAAELTSEFDRPALIIVAPGRFAVAMPFAVEEAVVDVGLVVLLMVTILVVCGAYVIVPIFARGSVQEYPLVGLHRMAPPGPRTVVSASNVVLRVPPWGTHAVWLGIVTDVTGGWIYTSTGLLVAPPPLAVTCTMPQLVLLHPLNDDRDDPAGGVQIVKLGTPPSLLRFHVPAQIVPRGEMSARSRLLLV